MPSEVQDKWMQSTLGRVRMFCRAGVFMLSFLVSGPALAQTVECAEFSAPTNKGEYGSAIPVTATRSNVIPSLSSDYVIAGGRCDFTIYTETLGVLNPDAPIIFSQRPIDGGNAISCRAGTLTQKGFVETTAKLFACRPKLAQGGHISARVNSIGLGTEAVVVAKNTGSQGAGGVVPFSVRLCNRTRSDDITIEIGVSTSVLGPNRCLEIDKPQRLFIRARSQSAVIAATYALFKPGTFKPDPKGRFVPAVPADAGDPVRPGQFRSAIADCTKPPAGQPIDPGFWGYCPMTELKDGKNYRICFDNGYSNQGEGLEWYGNGLRIITDRNLMNKGGQLSAVDYMSIAPAGCRDMFGVKTAWVLLTDPYNNWNGQSVSRVTYRYAEIPAP